MSSLLKMPLKTHLIAANSLPDQPNLLQCDRAYLVPPVASTKAYTKRLEEIIATERPDLIIPTIQAELSVLASLKVRLSQHYGCRFLLASSESLALATDKYRCGQELKDFVFIATALHPDEYKDLQQEWGYPLIAKPRWGSGSDHVRVLFNDTDLKQALSCVPDCVIQPFLIPLNWQIERTECRRSDIYHHGKLRQQDEFSVQVLVSPEGQILGSFTLKCTYQQGHPVKLEPIKIPVLEQQAHQLARFLVTLGFSGPLNLQAREFAKGRFSFYDINPRFTVATAARTCLGFAEVESLVLSFLKLPENFSLTPNYNAFVVRRYTDELMDYGDLERLRSDARGAF